MNSRARACFYFAEALAALFPYPSPDRVIDLGRVHLGMEISVEKAAGLILGLWLTRHTRLPGDCEIFFIAQFIWRHEDDMACVPGAPAIP